MQVRKGGGGLLIINIERGRGGQRGALKTDSQDWKGGVGRWTSVRRKIKANSQGE